MQVMPDNSSPNLPAPMPEQKSINFNNLKFFFLKTKTSSVDSLT